MKGLGKKLAWISCITAAAVVSRPQNVKGQVPLVGLVTSAIKKVITAIDISVQKLQNETIALQNAQQDLENNLSLGRLNDISGWLNKEKHLYQGYYMELAQVRQVVSDYSEIRQIVNCQKQLLSEYRHATALFHGDIHFSAEELSYMDDIYGGIMQESLRNLNEALLMVSSFSTQMDDAERMQGIHRASAGMQRNLDHLRQFNRQNSALSLTRAKDEQDRLTLKRLYGLR